MPQPMCRAACGRRRPVSSRFRFVDELVASGDYQVVSRVQSLIVLARSPARLT
jgi:hypothetical protein